MARLKYESVKVVTIKEREYLDLIVNKMIVDALKIARVEKLSIYKAALRILQDERVQVHIKPLCRRYSRQ